MARTAATAGHPGGTVTVWRATFAGLSASLIGIGLARFAYTPLVPALIAAGWMSPGEAAYIGAANLAGYLAGAVLARQMAARFPVAAVLRTMMVLATLSFIACAFPLSFWWFVLWRGAAGISGGALMVLAAPAVLPLVPAARRGLASGVMFTGVGIGVILSGTLVPLLLQSGLVASWSGIGALSLALTVAAWRGWPTAPVAPAARLSAKPRLGLALLALYLGYAFDAMGIVPHMVFLSDFVARALDRGVEAGAHSWVLFGIGGTLGPTLAGYLGDRIGFGRGLRLAFALQACCVGLLAVSGAPLAVAVSSLVIGAFAPGIVPLALGRVHELVDDADGRQAAWRLTTVAFALGQAAAAYGFSYLLSGGADYRTVFLVGAGALVAALALDLILSACAAVRRESGR